MSDVRVVLEAFAAGELDYAELQRRLNAALHGGLSVDSAVSELNAMRDSDGLSVGLYNVLRRAISRVSDGDDTSPFPDDESQEQSTAEQNNSDRQGGEQFDDDNGLELSGEDPAAIIESFERPDNDELPQMFTRPETLLEKELPEIRAAEPDDDSFASMVDPDPEEEAKATELPSGNWLDEPRPRTGSDQAQEPAAGAVDDIDADVAAGLPEPELHSEEDLEPQPDPKQAVEDAELPLPEAGEVLGDRYVIQSILGRGGMGIVYRVQDRCREAAGADNPDLAMKILKPELQDSPDAERRLLGEALQGQDLRHPGLVRILDLGRADGRAFMTMELLDGESLRNAITRHTPDGFPAAEALEIIRGLASGLGYLHQRGYVHSDFKPGNVLLSRSNEPKLLDFGLARRQGRTREPVLDGAGLPARTPAYASPQVLAGSAPDFRDDVFSLACVAYELIAGRHPFGRVPANEAMERKLKPARVSGISPQQRQTLRRSLSFEAARRPADANAFLKAMGLDQDARGLRPRFMHGALLGLAAGILLTLAIINPEGPVYRILADLVPATPMDVSTGTKPSAAQASLQEQSERAATNADAASERSSPDDVLSAGGTFSPSVAEDLTGPAEPLPMAEALPSDEAGSGEDVTALDAMTEQTDRAGAAFGEDPDPADTVAAARDAAPAVAAVTPPPPPAQTGPGRLQLDSSTYRVDESSAVLIARVIRTGGSSGRVAFVWRTVPGSATANEDYIDSDWQRVELGDGELSTRLFVPLVNDGRSEADEVFTIMLADPEAGAELGSRTSAEVTIADDDSGP
ncbi:MAG: protein kinase [Gammaproteobacteria bacterium]